MSEQHRWWYHGKNRKSESFTQSFRHASRGLALGAVFEANVRRQVLLCIAAILLGWFFHIAVWEWVLLVSVSVFVITLEFINSAIEALADAVHPGYSEFIQRSKDLSAAAVLCASVAALAAGLFIFLPRVGTIALWLVNNM